MPHHLSSETNDFTMLVNKTFVCLDGTQGAVLNHGYDKMGTGTGWQHLVKKGLDPVPSSLRK